MTQQNNTKAEKNSALTEGNVLKHLVRLALPMAWGIMMIISFQLVDTYFVSRLGTQELAAFSFTFPITYMIFTLIMGFSIAMSSVVSRLVGANEMDIVKRVVSHGLLIVTLISIFIATMGLLFLSPLFKLLGANEVMLPLIKDYMEIWFFGAVFVSLPMVGNSAMRACGDAITPALIMSFAAILNVILDPLLIFGLAGFPALGLQGAAIATVFANGCALLLALYVIYFKRKILSPAAFVNYKDFGDSLKRLCFIAIPAGLTNSIPPIINAVIIALLAKESSEAVAAFGVVSRIEAFAFIILMGVSVGMSPIIGQNFGAKKYDRVNLTIKSAINFSILWSALVAVILGFLGEPIVRLFSDDVEVVRTSIMFFLIVPFSYIFSNVLNGWCSAFNAVGMPQRAVIIIFTKYLVMLLPALHIGYNYDGIRGIFIAIAVVNVISGIIFHLWSARSVRKKCTS